MNFHFMATETKTEINRNEMVENEIKMIINIQTEIVKTHNKNSLIPSRL